MQPQFRAYLQILAGAVLLSSGSTVIKAVSFSAWELAAWRALIVSVFLLLAVRPPRACWNRALLPAALAHATTTLLFMWGNKLASAATAIFLQYTAPVYLLLLGPWLLREPITRRDIAIVALILCGMVILLLHPTVASATAPNPRLGSAIAAVCGIAWAFTTLTMRGLARQTAYGFEGTIAAVILANVALALCLLPVVGVPAQATPVDWSLVSYMGIFQLGSAFMLISLGLRHVTALEGGLLLLLEPVLNPLWAWLVHHEVPGVYTYIGGGLILLATIVRTLLVSSNIKPARG